MILVIIESMQIKSSRLHISTSYSENDQPAEIISFYSAEETSYNECNRDAWRRQPG